MTGHGRADQCFKTITLGVSANCISGFIVLRFNPLFLVLTTYCATLLMPVDRSKAGRSANRGPEVTRSDMLV